MSNALPGIYSASLMSTLQLMQQEIRASVELVRKTKMLGRLPVVNFAAGGVATPADAALMMQVGRSVPFSFLEISAADRLPGLAFSSRRPRDCCSAASLTCCVFIVWFV